MALVARHVEASEGFAGELVGDHLTVRIKGSSHLVDRGRTFRIPASALLARVLDANGTAYGPGQNGSISGCISGIIAAIGARANNPDSADLISWHAKDSRHAIPDEMRLLRSRPDGDVVALDVDDRTGGTHAGMRLERPLIFSFDHASGIPERCLDVAGVAFNLAFGDRRAANMVVKLGSRWERRLRVRPLHLQLFGCFDGIPFLLGHDSKQPLLPDNL